MSKLMKTTITIGASTYECERTGPSSITAKRTKGRAVKENWRLCSAFEKAFRAPIIAASRCPKGCTKDGNDLVSLTVFSGEISVLCGECSTRRELPEATINISKVEVLQ